MAIKPLKEHKGKDVDATLSLKNLKEFVAQLENNPLLGGRLITEISLVNGDNTIDHKLDRALKGWIITRIYDPTVVAPAVYAPQPYIYDKQSANTAKARTLILSCDGGGCTIDLWVF